MAAQFPETDGDRTAWTRLWATVRTPWERTEDLSSVLGVARSAVAQWATGVHRGPWSLLRASLRETARRHPEAVPFLVEQLAAELLDGARGRWVPAEDLGERDWADESSDLAVVSGELHTAVRSGDRAGVERAAGAFHRDVDEAICAARQQVRRVA